EIDLPPTSDVQANSRVRCLVKQSGGYGRTHLTLVDYTWDQTPLQVLAARATAALGLAQAKAAPATAASIYQQRQQMAEQLRQPNRGGDPRLDYERWIAYFN